MRDDDCSTGMQGTEQHKVNSLWHVSAYINHIMTLWHYLFWCVNMYNWILYGLHKTLQYLVKGNEHELLTFIKRKFRHSPCENSQLLVLISVWFTEKTFNSIFSGFMNSRPIIPHMGMNTDPSCTINMINMFNQHVKHLTCWYECTIVRERQHF